MPSRPLPGRTSVTRPWPSTPTPTPTVSPVTGVTCAVARAGLLALPADRPLGVPGAAKVTVGETVSPATASSAVVPYAALRAVSLFPPWLCLFRTVLSRFPIGRVDGPRAEPSVLAQGRPRAHEGGRVSQGRLSRRRGSAIGRDRVSARGELISSPSRALKNPEKQPSARGLGHSVDVGGPTRRASEVVAGSPALCPFRLCVVVEVFEQCGGAGAPDVFPEQALAFGVGEGAQQVRGALEVGAEALVEVVAHGLPGVAGQACTPARVERVGHDGVGGGEGVGGEVGNEEGRAGRDGFGNGPQ